MHVKATYGNPTIVTGPVHVFLLESTSRRGNEGGVGGIRAKSEHEVG